MDDPIRVSITFRELAALAPDAGLHATFDVAHDSYLADVDYEDEGLNDELIDDYVDWKRLVEQDPKHVDDRIADELRAVAENETWYKDALRAHHQ